MTGPRKTDQQPEVLTLAEASEFLRLCSHTVAKRATAGEIPGRKVGREWRFNRSSLKRYLDGNRAA
jgi:excisionase family DNA binding protein